MIPYSRQEIDKNIEIVKKVLKSRFITQKSNQYFHEKKLIVKSWFKIIVYL